jgi:hypothetical protein
MIETLDLLAENEVLQKRGPTLTSLQAVLIFDGTANIRGHESVVVIQIELGQEVFSARSRITLVTPAHARCLTRHVGTGSIGNANEARKEGKTTHCIDCGRKLNARGSNIKDEQQEQESSRATLGVLEVLCV